MVKPPTKVTSTKQERKGNTLGDLTVRVPREVEVRT
jgi:hypothetical protein